MIFLLLAALVYLLALVGSILMVRASNDGDALLSLFVGLITSLLWVVSMILIFKGLTEIGVFDALVAR